jgi:hypothetical protein
MRGYRKYGNKKTDGYDSKREATRAAELKLLEKIGVITNLQEQVRYEVIPKQEGERAAHYIADFVYMQPSGTLVAEDVKGFRTPDYILKRKLMKLVHGITIREVA